ncbi:MAG: right-handed parallel beta-helix repeat-containing protein [Pirellulales bacterium]
MFPRQWSWRSWQNRPRRQPPRTGRRYLVECLERRDLLAGDHFYVSPTGSNSAAGTAEAPWLTLQKAANTVSAGDTVTVRSGTYVGFDLRTDGTASDPITFSAEPGAVINQRNAQTPDGINLEGADYITIEGFTLIGLPRAGIRAVVNHHVTIRNNRADQNGRWGIFTGFSDDLLIENNETSRSVEEHGIYASNSGDRPVVRGNTIWGNHGNGIHLNGDESQGGDGIISGALIENNVIYDNGLGGGSGINGDGLQSSVIRNNLLYDNHASGISLYQIDAAEGAKNNLIVNNTIVQASNGRWALNIQGPSTGNRVYNNILYNYHSFRGSIDIDPDALAGFASDYNVVMNRFTTDDSATRLNLAQWRTATGQDMHSVVATPSTLFVDAAADDYRLSPNSEAIDAGTSTMAPAFDLIAAPRPAGDAWDIGAYEFSTGDATPPEVVAVRMRGSNWNAAVASVALPLGGAAGPTLPWVNLDTVEIAFDEAVVVSADDLDYTGDGVGDPVSEFTYDPATYTARWRLPSTFGSGDAMIALTANVVDLAGNSIAGGSIAVARVRPADVNGDAAVTLADLLANVAGQFVAIGSATYLARNDVDGNGLVNVVDATLVRNSRTVANSPAANAAAASAASLVAAARQRPPTPRKLLSRASAATAVDSAFACTERTWLGELSAHEPESSMLAASHVESADIRRLRRFPSAAAGRNQNGSASEFKTRRHGDTEEKGKVMNDD